MSFGRAQEAGRATDAPDALLSTSRTPIRSGASILADELSNTAGNIKWPRTPGLGVFEHMADMIISAGYYNFEELADTSAAERAQLYEILAGSRAGWVRLLQKMRESKAHPTKVEAEKSLAHRDVDILAANRANPSLSGIGELLRPRPESVSLLTGAPRGGSEPAPPYTPFLAHKPGEAPWPTQDPARKRANAAK